MMTANEQTRTDEGAEVSALRSALLSGGEVPLRILLAPWGCVESTNGSFIVDDESTRLVVEAFDEHATDLPIDYEHQTLGGTYSSPNGQAPAAGWVKRLIGEPGVGLIAQIEWTEQATELLASKQYRYLSPVAIIRKADRKLVAIHSAALTNKPAIVGMEPIVNCGLPISDCRLDEGDTQSTIDPPPCEVAALKAELDLPVDTPIEDVLVAAGRRLAQLQRDARTQQVEQRIREAMRAGKLVEAQRNWAQELVVREEELFDEWVRTAPIVVTPGKSLPPSEGDAGEHRQSLTLRARAEYRANHMLRGLTTEEAYVADALRHAV
ncbi:MAG: phage protease [Planctomycetota bacterium]|jgi:phage I-like protein